MLGRPYRKSYFSLSVVVSDIFWHCFQTSIFALIFVSQGTAYIWRPASSKNERRAVCRISFDMWHFHICICTRLWQTCFLSVVIWLLLANPVRFLRATTLPHRGSFGAIWLDSAMKWRTRFRQWRKNGYAMKLKKCTAHQESQLNHAMSKNR